MFSLENSLINDVVCQKRTGKNKQFVIMKGDYIYKGPYTEERLNNILKRSRLFSLMKTPNVVMPIGDQINTKDGAFLVYPNLAKDFPVEYDHHKESFSNLSYRVLRRNGLLKMNDVIDQECWIYDHIESILLTLLHFHILGVGDTHLANILIDIKDKKIYFIDYDENGKDRDNEFFYFSKIPSMRVSHIWLQYSRKHYFSLIEKLKSLFTVVPELSEQINKSIALLCKYADAPKGKMKFLGPFNGTTYSGYDLDIMKSALQKYIRRGNTEKALISAVELYRMAEIGGKAAQSNMYNRLAIIVAEDIGLANLGLCITVIKSVFDDNRNIHELATLIKLMCESQKTRIMSHLYKTYANEKGREIAKSMGIIIDECTNIEPTIDSNVWLPGDNPDIKPYAEMFAKRLREVNLNAISWLYHYTNITNGMKITPRKRITNPMIVIWDLLKPFLIPEVEVILRKAFFKFKENRPFLMLAITTALYKPAYIDTPIENLGFWQNSKNLDDIVKGNYEFVVDDYVIDIHTKEGRMTGSTRENFAIEGSFVANQSPLYWDDLIYNIYIKSNQ